MKNYKIKNIEITNPVNWMRYKEEYRLQTLSFQSRYQQSGGKVVWGDGANLQLWMLELIEEWCAEVREKL